MTSFLNELETLRADIDAETQVELNIDYHTEALFFRFDIPATLSLNKSF